MGCVQVNPKIIINVCFGEWNLKMSELYNWSENCSDYEEWRNLRIWFWLLDKVWSTLASMLNDFFFKKTMNHMSKIFFIIISFFRLRFIWSFYPLNRSLFKMLSLDFDQQFRVNLSEMTTIEEKREYNFNSSSVLNPWKLIFNSISANEKGNGTSE